MENKEYLNKYLGDGDRISRLYFSKLMAPYGMNSSRFIFFVSINRNPGITQAGVVRITVFEKSIVARGIVSLERDGFVYRVADENNRHISHWYPTEKGKEVYQHINQIITDWNEKIYAKLSVPKETAMAVVKEISFVSREILMENLGLDYKINEKTENFR